jgi:glycosyltransferase involved in cell wall biosynthesis
MAPSAIPPRNRNLPAKRAAHFLLIPELLYSPPNEAIIHALLGSGHEVHVFSPGRLEASTAYGPHVITHQAEYTLRWLIRNIARRFWRSISCFSGTSEDPLAVVGLLSAFHHRPSFLLVDEIKTGSYRGNSSDRWKALCRWAMRSARFNIVNDASRIQLLRDYAQLPPSAEILVYPGCFHEPPQPSPSLRSELRRQWGMPQDALIVAASGGFNLTAGADWLVKALREEPSLNAVIQPLGVDPLSLFLLKQLGLGPRMYLQEDRLSWQEAWRSAVGFDIGLAIYSNQAPQFQHMGISSNRLCMFIAMGVPVICSRQESFRFVEDYHCGVMVDSYQEFLAAIQTIGHNLEAMRQNCITCLEQYIMPPDRFPRLGKAISAITLSRRGNENLTVL